MFDEIRSHGLAMEALPGLRGAWTARSALLEQERYDRQADLLYAYLLEMLVPRKQETFDALLIAIRTATHVRDLEVPLWHYTACYYKTSEEPLFDTRIGTKFLGISGVPMASVYKVTHATDVLARLASAYGADFHIYDRHAETLSETDERVQTRREIVLAYYPMGLPEVLARRVEAAYARQLTRRPYTPSWSETVSVVEPMQTPPSSPPSSPPRIPKRCFCEHTPEEEV